MDQHQTTRSQITADLKAGKYAGVNMTWAMWCLGL